jgi:hypothetical protein
VFKGVMVLLRVFPAPTLNLIMPGVQSDGQKDLRKRRVLKQEPISD